jgi:hypothetical protein
MTSEFSFLKLKTLRNLCSIFLSYHTFQERRGLEIHSTSVWKGSRKTGVAPTMSNHFPMLYHEHLKYQLEIAFLPSLRKVNLSRWVPFSND